MGSPVAANDAWIAACCIAAGVPLMTLNRQHFEVIPGRMLLPYPAGEFTGPVPPMRHLGHVPSRTNGNQPEPVRAGDSVSHLGKQVLFRATQCVVLTPDAEEVRGSNPPAPSDLFWLRSEGSSGTSRAEWRPVRCRVPRRLGGSLRVEAQRAPRGRRHCGRVEGRLLRRVGSQGIPASTFPPSHLDVADGRRRARVGRGHSPRRMLSEAKLAALSFVGSGRRRPGAVTCELQVSIFGRSR